METAKIVEWQPKIGISAPRVTPPPHAPCPTCNCLAYWQDRYSGLAGPWRCLHCEPPPIEAMVARWLDVGVQCVGQADDDLEHFGRDWQIEQDDDAGRVIGTRRGPTERQRIGEPLSPVVDR